MSVLESVRPRLALAAAALTIGLMPATGQAASGLVLHYTGQTAQGGPVHFDLTFGVVKTFTIGVADTCPSGGEVQNEYVTDPMTEARTGAFSGTFGTDAEPLNVSGQITGSKAQGRFRDTTVSGGKSCTSGLVTYTATTNQTACGLVFSPYRDHGTNQSVETSEITAQHLDCGQARTLAGLWGAASRLSAKPAAHVHGFACGFHRLGPHTGTETCKRGTAVLRFNARDSSPFHH